MTKRILIVSANPKAQSLGQSLVANYQQRAKQLFDLRYFDLAEASFDPVLKEGYDRIQPLEDDLVSFQEDLRWCEHLVLVTPVWWGTMPAKLKGLFDRAFLPGYAFKYHEGKSVPEKLLQGRTAHLVLTLDTPVWYYRWWQRMPVVHQLKKAILGFVGIKTTKVTYFGPVIQSQSDHRQLWLRQMSKMGQLGL